MRKGITMNQDSTVVAFAEIVFADVPYYVDAPISELTFAGLYKSKYVTNRIYKYEMEKVPRESIEAFLERFRRLISENGKLRGQMRRYRDLRCNPSLLLGLSVCEFAGSQGARLVDYWTFTDGVAALAKASASIVWSFRNEEIGQVVRVEIPAGFVKFLAKHNFSVKVRLWSAPFMH